MTEDEKLVEKVATAIESVDETLRPTSRFPTTQDYARAAIAAVREHDKEKGLVHAEGTPNWGLNIDSVDRAGAERSSDLSAVKRYEIVRQIGETFYDEMVGRQMADTVADLHCVTIDAAAERVLEMLEVLYWPTGDRSAPAASREPDLPPSLTVRHRHMKGGIKG